MGRIGGNPDILEVQKKSKGAITEIGNFRASLNAFKENAKVPAKNVPPKLRKLYAWFQRLKTKDIEYLLELQNMYKVMQEATLPSMFDKIIHNESLTRKDIDALRLLKDILVESHKLKFGDRKVIEKIVTYDDVRRQMFSDKKTIKTAEIINEVKDEPVPQDTDPRGRGEGTREEDGKDSGDNENTAGS